MCCGGKSCGIAARSGFCMSQKCFKLCSSPLRWPRCLVPVVFQGDPFCLNSSQTCTLNPVFISGLHLLAILLLETLHSFALNSRLSLCVGACPDPSWDGCFAVAMMFELLRWQCIAWCCCFCGVVLARAVPVAREAGRLSLLRGGSHNLQVNSFALHSIFLLTKANIYSFFWVQLLVLCEHFHMQTLISLDSDVHTSSNPANLSLPRVRKGNG